jgi:hypothetical protein
MADVLFTDYRPFGGWEMPNTPVAIAEGDPESIFVAVDETGLPNGIYEVKQLIIWQQVAGKHMNFRLNLQGDDTGASVCKDSAGETGCTSSESGSIIVLVTDGTLKIDVGIEFPTQGGGGSADGTMSTGLIWWTRII